MTMESWIALVGGLVGGGSALAVLIKAIANRSKVDAEAEKIESDSDVSVAQTALKIVEAQRVEYTTFKIESKAELAELRREHRDGIDRLNRMRESMDKIIEENGKLKSEVQRLTIDNVQLTHQIEALRKELELSYTRYQKDPVNIINQPNNKA